MKRHLTLWLPEERIDLWMKFTITKSNSDPAQNYSLHFRNHKGKNLTWKNPILATRKLVLAMSKSIWQQGSSCKQSQQLPVVHLCFFKAYHSYERKEVGRYSRQFFVWRSLVDSCIQNGYTDGTSLRPRRTRTWLIISLGHRKAVLLKASGNHGAQNVSEKYWIQLAQEGCSKKRVEYCLDHTNSLAYFRAIQGHSCGIPIVSELMGYTSFPFNWKEYIFHRGCSWSVQSILGERTDSGWKRKRQSPTSSLLYTSEPFWWQSRWRRTPWWLRSSSESALSQLLETWLGCRLLDKNCPEQKIWECKSVKQSHLQSSPTILCQEIASSE